MVEARAHEQRHARARAEAALAAKAAGKERVAARADAIGAAEERAVRKLRALEHALLRANPELEGVRRQVEECAAGRPACDVRPGAVPKWGTHSCRRGGAKRALDTRGLSGVDPIQIDFHFGWDEMAHARDHPMQTMYAGTADRTDRMKVTAYF